jgi:hypothetical protein
MCWCSIKSKLLMFSAYWWGCGLQQKAHKGERWAKLRF